MFAVTTFGVSLAALLTLFAFKDWELRHDVKIFPMFRARLNEVLETHIVPAQKKLPEVGKRNALLFLFEAKKRFFASLFHLLHSLEEALVRVLHFIRGKRTLLRESDSVSPFLRDIAEYKKGLGHGRDPLL